MKQNYIDHIFYVKNDALPGYSWAVVVAEYPKDWYVCWLSANEKLTFIMHGDEIQDRIIDHIKNWQHLRVTDKVQKYFDEQVKKRSN